MKLAPVNFTADELIAIDRERYERSFAAFIAAAWAEIDPEPFVPGPHIKILADHLQHAYEVGGQKLLINICPGSAKSKIVSVMFPAWVWARNPSRRIISAAHNEELAIRDAAEQRTLVKTDWYQRHWKIDMVVDQDGKSSFSNTKKGFRKAHPISAMTGSRGNIVIVDDPHSVKNSESDVIRKGVVENFFKSVMNRLNNPAKDSIIVVMQRLHEEDLAGVILSKPGLGFDHLCIPLFADGEARKPTNFGWVDTRAEGENMHPERFTPQAVATYREALGPFAFAGQYQQRPVPADDGYFKREWFHIYKPSELPKHLYYYMTSDHASSGTGDWNVFRIWGVDSTKNLWLVDSFRAQCRMDEAMGVERDVQTGKATIGATGAFALIKKWSPMGWYPENDPAYSTARGFIDSMLRETDLLIRIEPMQTKGSGDKISKARGYQAAAAMGKIHLPAGPISDEALHEYVTFPAGKHDDQVDADSAIIRVLSDIMPAYIPQAVAPDEYEDAYAKPPLESASDSYWA